MKWRKDISRPYTYLGFTYEFSEYYDDPTVRRKQTTYGARFDPEFEERLQVLQDDAMFDQMLNSRGGRYDATIDKYYAVREFYDSVANSSPEYWMSTHPVLMPRSVEIGAREPSPEFIRSEILANGSYYSLYQHANKIVTPIVKEYSKRRRQLNSKLSKLKSQYGILTDINFSGDLIALPKWVGKDQPLEEALENRLIAVMVKRYNGDLDTIQHLGDDAYRYYAKSIMTPYLQRLDQFEWDLEDMELRAKNYFSTDHARALGTITEKGLANYRKGVKTWELLGAAIEANRGAVMVIKSNPNQYRIHIGHVRQVRGAMPTWAYGMINYMLNIVGWDNIQRYTIHDTAPIWVPDWKTTDVFCRILGQILERNDPHYLIDVPWGKIYEFSVDFYVSIEVGDRIRDKMYLVHEFMNLQQKSSDLSTGKELIQEFEPKLNDSIGTFDLDNTMGDEDLGDGLFIALGNVKANLAAIEREKKAEERKRREEERKRQEAICDEMRRQKEEEDRRAQEAARQRLAEKHRMIEEAKKAREQRYKYLRQKGCNLQYDDYIAVTQVIASFDKYLEEYWAYEDWRYTTEIKAVIDRLLSDADCDESGMGNYTADLEFPARNIQYPYAICRVMELSGGVMRLRTTLFYVPGLGSIPDTINPCVLYAIMRYYATVYERGPTISIRVDGNIPMIREKIIKLLKESIQPEE